MSDKYWAKLESPKWQQKRLEIFARDRFACRDCHLNSESDVETLHVHHLRYFKDRDPWDYPDELLITVCKPCHKARQELEDRARTALAIILGKLEGGESLPGHKYDPTFVTESGVKRIVQQLEEQARRVMSGDGYTEDIIFAWLPDFQAGQVAIEICKTYGMTWSELADRYKEMKIKEEVTVDNEDPFPDPGF